MYFIEFIQPFQQLEASCTTLTQQLMDSQADSHDYRLKYEKINQVLDKLKQQNGWKDEEIQHLKLALNEIQGENLDFKTQIQVFKELLESNVKEKRDFEIQTCFDLPLSSVSHVSNVKSENKDSQTLSSVCVDVESQTLCNHSISLGIQTNVNVQHVYTETEGLSDGFDYQNQSSGVIVDVMEMNQTTHLFSIQENEWKEKCGQLETELAFMSLLESQVETLMNSCRQFEEENVN